MTDLSPRDCWITPPEVVARVRDALGGTIPWDWMTSEVANDYVGAIHAHLYPEVDAFEYGWVGCGYLNPPYSSALVKQSLDKLLWHFGRADITEAVVLVNAIMSTDYGQRLMRASQSICFPSKRIQFISADPSVSASSNRNSQMICHLHAASDLTARTNFHDAFKDYGVIVQ